MYKVCTVRVFLHIPGGLVMMGVLSLTGFTVTETVAVPVRAGSALSTAITYVSEKQPHELKP